VGAHARENGSSLLAAAATTAVAAAAGSASLLEDSIVRVGFRKVTAERNTAGVFADNRRCRRRRRSTGT